MPLKITREALAETFYGSKLGRFAVVIRRL